MQECKLKNKRTVTCYTFCWSPIIKKFYSMSFFIHSLATALWFRCGIAEYSITKWLHETCFRLIYNDKHSTFHDHLKKIGPFLFILGACNFLSSKLAKGISSTIINRSNRRYNQGIKTFSRLNSRVLFTMILFGSRVWELVPDNLKCITLLHSFKEQIMKWNPENCTFETCI